MKRLKRMWWIAALAATALGTHATYGAGTVVSAWNGIVEPLDPLTPPITGLEFDKPPYPVNIAIGKDRSASVCITGRYLRPEWVLVYEDQPLTRVGTDKFEYCIHPLTGQETEFRLRAIGATGMVEERWYRVVFAQWGAFQDQQGIPRPKYTFLTVGTGFTSLTYQEGTNVDYSMTALAVKAALTYALPPRWDIQLNAFMTGPILSKNRDEDLRIFGANARFGYVLPWLKRPWKLSILAGLFYSQTFVTNDQFGYTGFVFPHLYPTLLYYFPRGDLLMAYVKYSALAKDFNPFSSEHEFAAGVGWGMPVSRWTRITFTLDFSDMRLDLGSVTAHSTVWVLGAGVML